MPKILIEYNSNNLEENNEEKKESIDIELTEQKVDLEMMKMILILRWSDAQEVEEEDIALANIIENYKSKLMIKIFRKSNWMIVW